jgi:pimeloyl-ACP methyl ester carboxylesterase
MTEPATPLFPRSDGVAIAAEDAGSGPPVVLLHGLTATRRYVLMGSRGLERRGHRTIAYDARGHGESSPAPDPARYEYADLAGDLEAVLDAAGVERAAFAGHSMGAATAVAFALAHPERVDALVLIGPAYDGEARSDPGALARWDRLADGLERGGVEGFVAAYDPQVGEPWRETVVEVVRQRLARHRHPEAVAAALRVVPRSRPFEGLARLEEIAAPALVVGSRDEADPGHPFAVAQAYAERIPQAELVVEAPGESPLAWRGGSLAAAIAAFLGRRA